MELPLVTMRKLTKSIVNQMRVCPLAGLKDGEVLGYMVNVHKSYTKALLIKWEGEYYVYGVGWTKDTHSCRLIFGRRWVRAFDTETARDDYFEAYEQAAAKATQQIFV